MLPTNEEVNLVLWAVGTIFIVQAKRQASAHMNAIDLLVQEPGRLQEHMMRVLVGRCLNGEAV